MTRAEKSPVKRIARGWREQEFVVEVRGEHLSIRPLRARRGGAAEVNVKWSTIYSTFFKPKAKKRITRGLLTR